MHIRKYNPPTISQNKLSIWLAAESKDEQVNLWYLNSLLRLHIQCVDISQVIYIFELKARQDFLRCPSHLSAVRLTVENKFIMFSSKRLQAEMRISHCMGRSNLVQSFDHKKGAIRAGTCCCYQYDITLRSQGKISLCHFFLVQVWKTWQQLLQNQDHFASNRKFLKSSLAKHKINHATGVHSGVFGFQLQQHLRVKKLCEISLRLPVQLKIKRLFQ